MGDEDKKTGIKVTDRRRFDTEGNEREEGVESKGRIAATSPESQASQNDHSTQNAALKKDGNENGNELEDEDGDSAIGDIEVSSFIMSLMTQALMQLGAVDPPEGVHVQIDKAAAKQCIDILALLQQKTKGNLDSVEEKLMEEILHNLRMAYVRFA